MHNFDSVICHVGLEGKESKKHRISVLDMLLDLLCCEDSNYVKIRHIEP